MRMERTPDTSNARPPPDGLRGTLAKLVRNARGEAGLIVFLGVLMALATLVQPRLKSPANLRDVLVQAAPLLMVTMAKHSSFSCEGRTCPVASFMATVAVPATAFNATSDAAIGPIFVAGLHSPPRSDSPTHGWWPGATFLRSWPRWR